MKRRTFLAAVAAALVAPYRRWLARPAPVAWPAVPAPQPWWIYITYHESDAEFRHRMTGLFAKVGSTYGVDRLP